MAEPIKVDMCAFYDVWHHPHIHSMWHPVCKKGRYKMVGIKCHSERPDCSGYKPSLHFEDRDDN